MYLNTFGKTYGNEKKYGYSPPDVKSISKGFNLTYFKIKKNSEILPTFKKFIKFKRSAILDVKISKYQPTAELHQISSTKNLIKIDY